MLNFNTIDNTNAFVNSITSHGGNFTEVPTSIVVTSSSPQSSSSSSIQVQQINLNYLNANAIGGGGDQSNWSETVHSSNNPTAVTIDNNCNRTTINNNTIHSNESSRVQHQKTYLQTAINDDQTNCRPPLNMDNFLQQKGSENVKRFSVNNLLQLANNCRALVDEHRISSGKLLNRMTFFFHYQIC